MSSIPDPPPPAVAHETRSTKTGWRPIQATDLRAKGNEPGTCERCGRRDLRFLHIVAHPDKGQLHVGCECAKRLCWGYDPERQEQRLRNLWARLSRWLTRNWATSWRGNATLTFKHGDERVWVTVFNRFRWSFCIAINGQAIHWGEGFATADEAKLGAFDRLAETLWDKGGTLHA